MAKLYRRVPIELIEYVSSTLKTRDIPKSVYRGLQFILKIVHTNGAAYASNLHQFLSVINKFDLVIDGQDTFQSFPFYHLYYQNLYDFSLAPLSSLFVTNSASGTSYIKLFMPFSYLRSLVPNDGMLDVRGKSSAVLNCNWMSVAKLSGVTSIDSGTQLEINSKEYTGLSQGETPPSRHEISWESISLNKIGVIQTELESKGSNQYYRLWLYVFTAAGVLSDAGITNIIVETRNFRYQDVSASECQAMNRLDYSIAHIPGVYVIDFTTDGRMSERLDARQLSDLLLKVQSAVTDGTMTIVKEKTIWG